MASRVQSGLLSDFSFVFSLLLVPVTLEEANCGIIRQSMVRNLIVKTQDFLLTVNVKLPSMRESQPDPPSLEVSLPKTVDS